jgi:MerR family transcriptional regulator, light-induced transcriptional regulator
MQEVDRHFESSSASALSRRSSSGESPEACKTVTLRGYSSLARVVETEILPRLLTVNQPTPAKLIAETGPDADLLANLVLRGDNDEAWAFVEARIRDGVAPRKIMTEAIAPAARRLGELWESDACDFMQVTVGLRRLQGLLRGIDPEEDRSVDRTRKAPTILFSAAPGENHLLGVQMVASLFSSEGWRVARSDAEACSRRLSEQWFDAIGFSVNCERFFDNLRLMIERARLASRNPGLRVLVGGSIFASDPEIGRKLGADDVAPDFETAIYLSRILL